jgi:hypothetical protein
MLELLQEVDVNDSTTDALAALSDVQLALIGGGTGDATLC